jgi:sugar/nucleoside kinase (ribokinase family)
MRIAGAGCAVADFLYADVNFEGEAFLRFRSRRRGDGGITPGGLVFVEEFEEFAGMPFKEAVRWIVGSREPDSFNLGGPAIVALTLVAQLLAPRGVEVEYYGVRGQDDAGARLLDIARRTPLRTDGYEAVEGPSSFTMVLSDPKYDAGRGERAFLNAMGVSAGFGPEDLPDRFFDADVVLLAATALVPRLHARLTDLLKKAKERGCVTVVTTVYDFRSEKANPGAKWPLGESEETYACTDLLIADREEALRISGERSDREAYDYFKDNGLSAFAITNGPEPVWLYSREGLFRECPLSPLPVCRAVGEAMAAGEKPTGDTTGCGDNFAAGVIASLAAQMMRGGSGRGVRDGLHLAQAVAAGVCAGGSACFHLGGTVIEKTPGERAREIGELYARYREQVRDACRLSAEFPA